MSDLGTDLRRAFADRADLADLSPASVRSVVRGLGGGGGRTQVAAGNKHLAGQLGVSVRTVQRWQKEGGEARSVSRSTPGLRVSVRGVIDAHTLRATVQRLRPEIQARGLDVGPCRLMTLVYNEPRARPRNVGGQHIGGDNDNLMAALDALAEGDTAAAGEAFGTAWLGTYGMDVDAEVTDVQGAFALAL